MNSRRRPTWNSLKTMRPLAATISKRTSKWPPSVVSLYGAQSAKVRKSNKADITRAPVLWTYKKVAILSYHVILNQFRELK